MSKQATAGTSGRTRSTTASAASDFGWCSGARSVSARRCASTASSSEHRAAEARAAVDDPVAHRRDRAEAGQRGRDQRGVGGAARCGQVGAGDHVVGLVEDAQLEAAGAGVDDEDPGTAAISRHGRAPTAGRGPAPARDLGGVLALEAGVRASLDPPVDHQLANVARAGAEARHAVDDIDHEVEPVEVVEHDHVERRRGRAFLLVPADVQVGVVRPAVGEAVDQPRVAVVGEDDRLRSS